jgi:hypothetical protein
MHNNRVVSWVETAAAVAVAVAVSVAVAVAGTVEQCLPPVLCRILRGSNTG